MDRPRLFPRNSAPSAIRLEHHRNLLWIAGAPVRLTPKESDVLNMLMENVGETVRRAEIIEEVWGGNHLIGEAGLSKAIHSLRRHLGDDAKDPRFIRTLPRVGFSFLQSSRDEAPQCPPDAPEKIQRDRRPWILGLGPGVLFMLATLAVALISDEQVFPEPVLVSSLAEGAPSIGGSGDLMLATEEFAEGAATGWDVRVREWPSLRLAHEIASEADERRPALSPDGRHLAYLLLNQGCRIIVHDLALQRTVWTVPCEGHWTRKVSWSSDSDRLVFAMPDGLHEARVSERTDRVLIAPTAGEYFMKPRYGEQDAVSYIQSRQTDDGAPVVVTLDLLRNEHSLSEVGLPWISDQLRVGRILFVSSGRPGNSGVWAIRNGRERKLTDTPVINMEPVPEGLLLDTIDADFDICVRHRDEPQCHAGFSSSAMDQAPRLLSHGRLLTFTSNRLGETALYVYDTEKRALIGQVTLSGEGLRSGPYQLGDGRLVMLNDGQLIIHDVVANRTIREAADELSRLLGVLDDWLLVENRLGAIAAWQPGQKTSLDLALTGNGRGVFDPHRRELLIPQDRRGNHATYALRVMGDALAVERGETRALPEGRLMVGDTGLLIVREAGGVAEVVNEDGSVALELADARTTGCSNLVVGGDLVAYEQYASFREDIEFLQVNY